MASDRGKAPRRAASTPPFFEFTAERYDTARAIALLERILIAIQRGDVSKAGPPLVPVPIWDQMKREFKRNRLRRMVAQITGETEGGEV